MVKAIAVYAVSPSGWLDYIGTWFYVPSLYSGKGYTNFEVLTNLQNVGM